MNLILKKIQRDIYQRKENFIYKNNWQRVHIDFNLLMALCALITFGLFILYSAVSGSEAVMARQLSRLALAFGIAFIVAQITPRQLEQWAPWLYSASLVFLVAVLIIGHIGKGAQRWIELGFFRFQPSEFMKIAVPLMLAWYFSNKNLPVKFRHLFSASLLILIPALLIAKQPDLGTALVIMMTGGGVLLFAGISWRLLAGISLTGASIAPFLWHYMHDYQRRRVLTFLDPEKDPLGHGYHIIQSKIAIGSGGVFGKGFMQGTQSHLQFLPEHATDFIFAVCGEEFGLIGTLGLLTLFTIVISRSLFIATQAQDTFTRLLAGSLALTFFISVFVNIGMVSGILPVVGLPLPLVSYGGTSIVSLMAGFGILMSIQTHRKLLPG